MVNYTIKQSDCIQIVTTKNIKYLSAPVGHIPTPDKIWCVIGILNNSVLASSGSTMVLVPLSDVKIVQQYNPGVILRSLERLNPYGKEIKKIEK